MKLGSHDLKSDAIIGLRFSAVSKIFEVITFLFIAIVMARLLEPEDFGLIAMCSVFTGISALLVDLGTSDAIIRSDEDIINDGFLSSIFWINFLIGIVVASSIILMSGWISELYGYEIIQTIVTILSVNIIFSAMVNVPTSIVIRNLDFKKIFYQKVLILPISGFIGITMAMNGYGIWSLVTQQIVNVTGGSLFLWYLSKWAPTISFDIQHIKKIFHFSGYLSLSKFVNYSTKKGDLFLIGKYIGAESLGIYSKCYQFTVLTTKSINGIIIKVMYPYISKIKGDKQRLSEIFLSISQVMLTIYSIIFLIGAMYSKEIVYVVLGEKWSAVVPLLPIFLLLGLFFGLGSISSHFLKAFGHAKLVFKIMFFNAILTIFSFIVGLQWGIKGVAIGYLFSVFILFILFSKNCIGYLPLKLTDLFLIFLKNIIVIVLTWLIVDTLVNLFHIETDLMRLMSGTFLILLINSLYHIFLNTIESRIILALMKN
ncbi:lipopolysaccharide biosynthesis protein [Candidatus Pseudothioglobus singularis]|nr:lipopolysaccharide biosynthesis protein [Candidatus Pseudothioglobus singularis]